MIRKVAKTLNVIDEDKIELEKTLKPYMKNHYKEIFAKDSM